MVDRDARVILPASDGGYFDLAAIWPAKVHPFVNSFPGAGPHDIAHLFEQPVISTVILRPQDEGADGL